MLTANQIQIVRTCCYPQSDSRHCVTGASAPGATVVGGAGCRGTEAGPVAMDVNRQLDGIPQVGLAADHENWLSNSCWTRCLCGKSWLKLTLCVPKSDLMGVEGHATWCFLSCSTIGFITCIWYTPTQQRVCVFVRTPQDNWPIKLHVVLWKKSEENQKIINTL